MRPRREKGGNVRTHSNRYALSRLGLIGLGLRVRHCHCAGVVGGYGSAMIMEGVIVGATSISISPAIASHGKGVGDHVVDREPLDI